MSAIPQRDALILYLAAIAGNEPGASYLEGRLFTPDAELTPKGSEWFPVRDLCQAADRIVELAGRRSVYVGAAPRVRQDGHASAVDRVWTLWADIDDNEARDRLGRFTPSASVLIASGTPGHRHAWWPLRESVPAEWARRANRALQIQFGGDNVADPARIMRPPATFNYKTDPPRPVVCERLELDCYTLEQVVGGLPDHPDYRPKPPPKPRQSENLDGSKALAGLVNKVRDAPAGNRDNTMFWAVNRARDHVDAGGLDPDEAHATLYDAATSSGYDERKTLDKLRRVLHPARVAA